MRSNMDSIEFKQSISFLEINLIGENNILRYHCKYSLDDLHRTSVLFQLYQTIDQVFIKLNKKVQSGEFELRYIDEQAEIIFIFKLDDEEFRVKLFPLSLVNKDIKEKVRDDEFMIKSATKQDAGLIFSFIKDLAEYEKLSDEIINDEQQIYNHLFSENSIVNAIIGYYKNIPVCFAVFFCNYSTFVGRHGLYLEDLYVKPDYRKKGFGKRMLEYLSKLCVSKGYKRFEWSVLNWNKDAINFYNSIGAIPMDGWTVYRLTGNALDSLANGI